MESAQLLLRVETQKGKLSAIQKQEGAKMKLEDLTHEELTWLINKKMYPLPTEHDLLNAHWERLSREARDTMKLGTDESAKWQGRGDMVSISNWWDAQEIFTNGLKIAEEAQKVWEQMQGLNQSNLL